MRRKRRRFLSCERLGALRRIIGRGRFSGFLVRFGRGTTKVDSDLVRPTTDEGLAPHRQGLASASASGARRVYRQRAEFKWWLRAKLMTVGLA